MYNHNNNKKEEYLSDLQVKKQQTSTNIAGSLNMAVKPLVVIVLIH